MKAIGFGCNSVNSAKPTTCTTNSSSSSRVYETVTIENESDHGRFGCNPVNCAKPAHYYELFFSTIYETMTIENKSDFRL